MSTQRTLSVVASLALAGLVLSSCASSAEDGPSKDYTNDVAGTELAGAVRIVSVDQSTLQTDGTVRYVLANIEDEDQDALTARVTFYYPPTQTGSIALPFDTDVTDEMDVPIFKGETDFKLEATSRDFAERSGNGDTILATTLSVERDELVPIIAAEPGTPGTRLLKDRMECVGISNPDLRLGLAGAAPEMWFRFQNRSDRSVSRVQVKVVFLDTEVEADKRRKVGETGWQRMDSIDPGATATVNIDLEGMEQFRSNPFLVRVRQSSVLVGGLSDDK